MQDEGDGSSSTSDGVFVYLAAAPAVEVGDEVGAFGNATDQYKQTQISVTDPSNDVVIQRCGVGRRVVVGRHRNLLGPQVVD